MGVFNNIKIELFIFLIICLSIVIPIDIDTAINSYFLSLKDVFGGSYVKEFFISITNLS